MADKWRDRYSDGSVGTLGAGWSDDDWRGWFGDVHDDVDPYEIESIEGTIPSDLVGTFSREGPGFLNTANGDPIHVIDVGPHYLSFSLFLSFSLSLSLPSSPTPQVDPIPFVARAPHNGPAKDPFPHVVNEFFATGRWHDRPDLNSRRQGTFPEPLRCFQGVP
jgi:hypothetical protein